MNTTQRDGSKMSHNSAPKTKQRNLQYVVEPEMVQTVWQDPDPNRCVQKIILEYVRDYSESVGQDLVAWD